MTRPELRGLDGLGRIWFRLGATHQYYPLLHSAFWLEHRLWGDAVWGYHLVNVFCHAFSAWLVFRILRRLEVRGAPLAAAVFALHPVHVESVAWISEQKNTLSTVFYLVAMLAYLGFDRDRRASSYLLAVGSFALALLTKTVTATLPGAILVVLWWRRGRLSWKRDFLPLAPWFALATAGGLVTVWVERQLIGAEGADFQLGFLARCLVAGRAICFYVGQLLWPAKLMFVYPRWAVDPSDWSQYLFPLGVCAALAALWKVRGWSCAPLAGFLFFCGSLFPVLGFFNVYPFVFSFVADHFQYVASLGALVLVSASAALGIERLRPSARIAARAACVAVVGILAALTWRQSHVYRDPETLYTATLASNPGCWMCRTNLGSLMSSSGRFPEAVEQYREALRIKADSADAHNNLGNALVRSGSVEEALPHYHEALRLRAGFAEAHANLGNALYLLERDAEAVLELEAALRIRPDYAPAQKNLSLIRGQQPGTTIKK